MPNVESGSSFRWLPIEDDGSVELENWTKVGQAVIAAGGKGSRIPPEYNPNGSKVLIEHKGKTLFEHQLNALMDGGVERFIVSTGYHTDRKIREIVYQKGVEAAV